jgi:1-pyrroline-5-carboxylate dehydrogenase
VQGKWINAANCNWIVDPLNGDKFIKVAEIQGSELKVWMLLF